MQAGAGFQSLKSKFQHRGGLSFAFLCPFSCMVVLCGTIEVCRVEVYSVLFAVCAFYPVCDMWCCLSPYNAIQGVLIWYCATRPYKAKGVVLYAPVFYLSILKGIISPVWQWFSLKCVELKCIAFNIVLYRCRWFSLILCLYSSLQSIRKQIRRH